MFEATVIDADVALPFLRHAMNGFDAERALNAAMNARRAITLARGMASASAVADQVQAHAIRLAWVAAVAREANGVAQAELPDGSRTEITNLDQARSYGTETWYSESGVSKHDGVLDIHVELRVGMTEADRSAHAPRREAAGRQGPVEDTEGLGNPCAEDRRRHGQRERCQVSRWMLVMAMFAGCSKPASSRAYWGIVALDDGSALVTWHDRGRTFGVSRLDASARYLWSADLEGRPQGLPPDHGFIVTDHVVALRTYHRSERQQMVEEVSLENGHRSWVARLRASADGVDGFSGFATDDAFRFYLRPDRGAEHGELIALDPSTGRERGRTSLPVSTTVGETVSTLAGNLIVSQYDTVVVANGADVTILESRGYGCVIADEYWRLVRTAERWELAPTRDKTRRPIPVEPVVSDRDLKLEGCGAYGDSFVLFVHAGSNTELRILDAEGNVLRRASLGVRAKVDGLRPSPRSRSTGALPRFTPVWLGDRRETLAMVDLEQGLIAWQAPSSVLASVFRSGSRWYWSWPEDTSTKLVVMDGDTGLGKAVQIGAPARLVSDLGPWNVAGDSIWLLANLDSPSTSPPGVARLDIDTLQVRAATTEFVVTEVPFDSLKEARNR